MAELRKIMTAMGERMPRKEFEAMVKEVDKDNDGLINCQGYLPSIFKSPLHNICQSFVLSFVLKGLERQKRRRGPKIGREE